MGILSRRKRRSYRSDMRRLNAISKIRVVNDRMHSVSVGYTVMHFFGIFVGVKYV